MRETQTPELKTIRKSGIEENLARRRDCFERCRQRRLAKIVITALGCTLLSWSIAEAAACLATAEEVRKLTPGAWPRWTYGPNRERCWYSGQKPVFAKAAPSPAPLLPAPMPQAMTEARLQEDNSSAEPVKHLWALEYRWSATFEIRHQARDEPLTYWVGDDAEYDSYGVSRALGPSQ